MKETIDSAEFENFFELKKKYDITLKILSPHFIGTFIDNVLEDPYYLEIKLYMIEYLIPNF